MIRPPLAAGRLQILDAEHIAFSLKSICSDGTYQIVLSPQELLEKLAALVPPPRLNLGRYHSPGRSVPTWKGLACRHGRHRSPRLDPIRSMSSTWTTQLRLPEEVDARCAGQHAGRRNAYVRSGRGAVRKTGTPRPILRIGQLQPA